MDIKPIETVYKGYRFRSRLEARWAVFFDSLNVKWEYEIDGYRLDSGAYLPDFWLPEQKTFVEIKKENEWKRTRGIYLAGKIYSPKADWRNRLIVSGDNWTHSVEAYSSALKEYPPSVTGGYMFTGPFVIDELGGHSSGHFTSWGEDSGHMINNDVPARIVFEGCRKQVGKSDILFAWIDDLSCYGTLVEIGMASALGKEIWLGISTKINVESGCDLWFVRQSAHRVVYADDARTAFSMLERPLAEHEIKCAELAASTKNKVYLVEGTPGSGDYTVDLFDRHGNLVVCGGHFTYSPNSNLIVPVWQQWYIDNRITDEALTKAKQARFEHGENGGGRFNWTRKND